MKSVVITGVSTGIGHAAAETLIRNGIHVFGSVRKKADADRVKNELGPFFTPLIFDVTDEAAIRRAADDVRKELNGQKLSGLVNNAGIAVAGPLLHMPPDELRHQMEVNLIGPMMVSQAFGPLLGADTTLKGASGRIVMISSVAGENGQPFMGPYAASKHALEGLSESLRRELIPFGIDVILIGPGAVKTPIWDKANDLDISRYANTPYAKALGNLKSYMMKAGSNGIPAARLGDLVLHVLTTEKPKTRYRIVPSALESFMLRTLPKRTVDRLIAKRLGLSKL